MLMKSFPLGSFAVFAWQNRFSLAWVEREHLGHGLVDLLLFVSFRGRSVNLQHHDLVARLLAWPTTTAQAQLAPAVGTWRHAQFHFSGQCRHRHRYPQCSFPWTYREYADDVASVQAESRIIVKRHFEQQVTGRPTGGARIALTVQANLPTRFDAGRNLHFERPLSLGRVAQGDALAAARKCRLDVDLDARLHIAAAPGSTA